MSHEWKIGDWCEVVFCDQVVRGIVYYINYIPSDVKLYIVRKGLPFETPKFLRDIVDLTKATYIPDCTGWDWVEPLQLKEGCWYERRDGEIVKAIKISDGQGFKYKLGNQFIWIDEHGFYRADHLKNEYDLIREVPAPTPPAPKYRAFANMEEFGSQPLREVRESMKSRVVRCVTAYSDETVCIQSATFEWEDAFNRFVFANGEPFGVKCE